MVLTMFHGAFSSHVHLPLNVLLLMHLFLNGAGVAADAGMVLLLMLALVLRKLPVLFDRTGFSVLQSFMISSTLFCLNSRSLVFHDIVRKDEKIILNKIGPNHWHLLLNEPATDWLPHQPFAFKHSIVLYTQTFPRYAAIEGFGIVSNFPHHAVCIK